jgi:hypothetical protein
LYGFEAISHHNGWAIAATGACIVFTGLATLSLIISQLQKLVALLDRPPKVDCRGGARRKNRLDASPRTAPTTSTRRSACYLPLIEELDPSSIGRPLCAGQKYHLPHPHLSIRCLLDAGKLQPLGEGIFRYAE